MTNHLGFLSVLLDMIIYQHASSFLCLSFFPFQLADSMSSIVKVVPKIEAAAQLPYWDTKKQEVIQKFLQIDEIMYGYATR
jgi:hypothetical protein